MKKEMGLSDAYNKYQKSELLYDIMSVDNFQKRREKRFKIVTKPWLVYRYYDIVIDRTHAIATIKEKDLYLIIRFAEEDSIKLFYETQHLIARYIPKWLILWYLKREIKKRIPVGWIDIFLEPFADEIYYSALRKRYVDKYSY